MKDVTDGLIETSLEASEKIERLRTRDEFWEKEVKKCRKEKFEFMYNHYKDKAKFTHNGYKGTAEVSVEDKCLYGKIMFIDDLVTYEAQDIESLETEFRKAVEDYQQLKNSC